MDIKEQIKELTGQAKALKREYDGIIKERNRLMIRKFEKELKELFNEHKTDTICLRKLGQFKIDSAAIGLENPYLDFYESERNNRYDLWRLKLEDGHVYYKCFLYGQDSSYDESEYFGMGEDYEWIEIFELSDPIYQLEPRWLDSIVYGLRNCEEVWEDTGEDEEEDDEEDDFEFEEEDEEFEFEEVDEDDFEEAD